MVTISATMVNCISCMKLITVIIQNNPNIIHRNLYTFISLVISISKIWAFTNYTVLLQKLCLKSNENCAWNKLFLLNIVVSRILTSYQTLISLFGNRNIINSVYQPAYCYMYGVCIFWSGLNTTGEIEKLYVVTFTKAESH